MGRINSKKKGNRAERTAKDLMQAWTGYEFERVPQSGGLRWKKREDVVGDLTCITKGNKFPFTIEVKWHHKIDFSHLVLDNLNCDILSFWKQAREDAKRINKVPLLMFRYNGLPANFFFIGISRQVFEEIKYIELKTQQPKYSRYMVVRNMVILNPAKLLRLDYKLLEQKINAWKQNKKRK